MAKDFKLHADGANAGLDGLGATYNSGALKFYAPGTGGIPATAATALTDQVLLCTITLPASAFAAASGGSIAKAGTWSGSVAESDTPTFYRVEASASTDVVAQGTVGLDTGDFDIEFDSVTWLAGGTVTVDTYTLTLPLSS